MFVSKVVGVKFIVSPEGMSNTQRTDSKPKVFTYTKIVPLALEYLFLRFLKMADYIKSAARNSQKIISAEFKLTVRHKIVTVHKCMQKLIFCCYL